MLSLTGKSVVFTGCMAMPRTACQELVLQAGGTIQKCVSRHTDCLVLGSFRPSQPGGISRKLRKAIAILETGRPILIIPENAFYEMIGIQAGNAGRAEDLVI